MVFQSNPTLVLQYVIASWLLLRTTDCMHESVLT